MDEQEIRDLWQKLISQEEHQKTFEEFSQMTYKGLPTPKHAKTILPQLTFSQEEMDDLFDEEVSKNAEMESQNTIIDNFSRIKNLYIGNPSANYKIFDEIARGGMGVIYRGKQLSLQREIAIKKLIQNKKTLQLRNKFINEAIVTAFLDHPNIIPVHELGENEQGDVILAMKIVKGQSWKDILYQREIDATKKDDILPHLDILLSVCNAVAFAHSKHIIHNDLKPENVMIGAFGEVVVMDWGIAIDISDNAPEEKKSLSREDINSPMGTPQYMPIELAQGKGEDIGYWTDTYLLGGILYEIIMRKVPHEGKNIWQVINRVLEGPKFDFPEKTPLELQEICKKSLRKEPQQRYQTVHEFRQVIVDFLQHRESIVISDKARQLLTECKNTVSKVTSSQLILQKRERNQLYDQFAQCVARFQQAIELWDENKDAFSGLDIAHLKYAQIALHNGDLGLAEAQVTKLSYHLFEVRNLKDKIHSTKVNKLRHLKNHQRMRSAFQISIISIILVLLISFLVIYNKAQEATKQGKIANEKRKEATKQREIADEKRKEATKQTEIADEKRKEAENLQIQKTLDAHKSRIKLARIALKKSQEAHNRNEWDRSGAYAGEALEFIKNIKKESSYLEELNQSYIMGEAENIKKNAQRQIRFVLENRHLLWESFSFENILQQKVDKICVSTSGQIATVLDKNIYLWKEDGTIIASISAHEKKIRHIAFHPYLQILASSDGDTIKLWDTREGNLLKKSPRYVKNVLYLEFSHDGKYLAYNTRNTYIALWQISSEKNVAMFKHKGVQKIFFGSHNFVSIAKDNTIKIWNTALEEPYATIQEKNEIRIVAHTNDMFAYAINNDKIIKIHQISSGNSITSISYGKNLKDLAFIHGKNMLVGVDEDNLISIWSIASQNLISTFSTEKDVTNIITSPFLANKMIVAKKDGVTLWNLEGKQLKNFLGHESEIGTLNFTPDGSVLMSTSANGKIKLWQTQTGKLLSTLQKHTSNITCVAFEKNMKFFASGADEKDSTSILWDMKTKTPSQMYEHNNKSVNGIAFSNKGNMIAVGSGEDRIILQEIENKKDLQHFSDLPNIIDLFFTKDDRFLVVVHYDQYQNESIIKWLGIYDQRENFTTKVKGRMNCVKLSYDKKTIVSIVDSTIIYLWNIESRSMLNKLGPFPFSISHATLSSQMLAVNTSDKEEIKIIDIENGHIVFSFDVAEKITHLSLSPDGDLLAVATNRKVKVFQLPIYIDDRFSGNDFAIDKQNENIAIVNDQIITIWDLKSRTQKTRYEHNSSIQSIFFNPSQNSIVFIDITKSVILWDLKNDQKINLSKLGSFIAYSNNGKKIAANHQNVSVIISDAISKEEISPISFSKILQDLTNDYTTNKAYFALQFSLDDKLLAIFLNNLCILWDLELNKRRDYFINTANITCSDFSKNNVVMGVGTEIVIWNFETKEKIVLSGHKSTISSTCWLGLNTVASGDKEGNIIIWDIQKHQKLVSFSTQEEIRSLVFLPKKQILLSSATNYQVNLWKWFSHRNIIFNKSFSQTHFNWDEKDKVWSTQINLESQPRETLQRIFGYYIDDDFSSVLKIPTLFLWE